VPDANEIRKLGAAAEHTARVAALADEAVVAADAKVEKAKADLTAAGDAARQARDDATAAHAEASACADAAAAVNPTRGGASSGGSAAANNASIRTSQEG
jgi:hypothetical protein